jgi:hypothetical protein
MASIMEEKKNIRKNIQNESNSKAFTPVLKKEKTRNNNI